MWERGKDGGRDGPLVRSAIESRERLGQRRWDAAEITNWERDCGDPIGAVGALGDAGCRNTLRRPDHPSPSRTRTSRLSPVPARPVSRGRLTHARFLPVGLGGPESAVQPGAGETARAGCSTRFLVEHTQLQGTCAVRYPASYCCFLFL